MALHPLCRRSEELYDDDFAIREGEKIDPKATLPMDVMLKP